MKNKLTPLLVFCVIALWAIAISCVCGDNQKTSSSKNKSRGVRTLTLYSGNGSVINQWNEVNVRLRDGFVVFRDKDGNDFVVSGTVVIK